MKVKDVMVTKVVTLKPSTTLSALLQLFKERNFHTLPVVDSEGYIKGVIVSRIRGKQPVQLTWNESMRIVATR